MALFSITNRPYEVNQTMFIRANTLLIAVIAGMAVVHGSVPIIVSGGAGKRVAMNFSNKAEKQLENGDVAGAKRNVDAALHADPKFWPALYQRAEIYASQGQSQLAIQDCNEALRQYPGFVEASLLRATINAHLGKYAEALKEFNYLVSIHPRRVTLGRALKQRAWFQSTCPDPAFRNGQQAVKDAKAACSIFEWRDESALDTLATAYAETGDFDSAVRYAAQALAVKGITPVDSKRIQQHLTSFQQHRPIRL
jgi:tetratricopeptide (TPR) repeat protein